MFKYKLYRLLPNFILKRYISKNISKLDENDFFILSKRIKLPFDYIEKNDKLSSSSKVLSYILDNDPKYFKYFKESAFTEENLNKLVQLNITITLDDLDKYPFFLDNEKFIIKLLKEGLPIVKRIPDKKITNEVIRILEEASYIPDINDIESKRPFLKSKILLHRAINNNPRVILIIKPLSDETIDIALKAGFIPSKEELNLVPELCEYPNLLRVCLENDPSYIVFFKGPLLTDDDATYAINHGYVPSEIDLIANNDLCYSIPIMKSAIEHDARLIIYAKCNLDEETIKSVKDKYVITRDDILANPTFLFANYELFVKYFPEFKEFNFFMSSDEKIKKVFERLKEGKPISISEYPFLDYSFGGSIDINLIAEVFEYLKLSFDENDEKVQELYYNIFNKLSHRMAVFNYNQNKLGFKYPSAIALLEELIDCFIIATKEGDSVITKLSTDLYDYIGNNGSYDYIESTINELYNIFLNNNNMLTLNQANSFIDYILNHHRNHFISEEKKKFDYKAIELMDLSKKRKMLILNRKKQNIVQLLIQNKRYDKLGITEAKFDEMIKDVIEEILDNKKIKKEKVELNTFLLNALGECFKTNGYLTMDVAAKLLGTDNEVVISYICKKFEQIKFKLFDNVELSEKESQITEYDRYSLDSLNAKDFIIGSMDRYYFNLSRILVKLNNQTCRSILENKEIITEILYLLPLVDLIDDFNIDLFIDILISYDRIRKDLFEEVNKSAQQKNNYAILDKIDKVIYEVKEYKLLDDVSINALGTKIVKELDKYEIPAYLSCYLAMLHRQEGYIPPISLEDGKFKLDSGMYSDPERLLIGKKPTDKSCIDLTNFAGAPTFNEALLLNSGDVILVRDSNNNLLTRIFLFRRGNVVQLMTRRGEDIIPLEIYEKVADEIIRKAIETGDNIDYVFLNNNSYIFENDRFPLIEDFRFFKDFPHCDNNTNAFLLSSKNKINGKKTDELNIDFEQEPKSLYKKARKKISYNPTEIEITRLIALNIALEKDPDIREENKRKFKPFIMDDYKKVICGEDWYLAIRMDDTIEEMILPTADERTYDEIENIKSQFGISGRKNIL